MLLVYDDEGGWGGTCVVARVMTDVASGSGVGVGTVVAGVGVGVGVCVVVVTDVAGMVVGRVVESVERDVVIGGVVVVTGVIPTNGVADAVGGIVVCPLPPAGPDADVPAFWVKCGRRTNAPAPRMTRAATTNARTGNPDAAGAAVPAG